MRIASSSVQMHSAHSYAAISRTASKTTTGSVLMAPAGGLPFSQTNLAQKGQTMGFNRGSFRWENPFLQTAKIRKAKEADSDHTLAKMQKESLDYLMMLFFGKTPKSFAASAAGASQASAEITQGISQASPGITQGISQTSQGLSQGLLTRTTETVTLYHEQERTTFSTTGTVVTADGREIPFQLEAAMSRSFTEQTYRRVQQLATTGFCDPLVINLDTDTANISDQKFYFDLDADGHKEAISTLGAGSGFLALDKNGDGKINDGSELFGAKSGNGFADLAKYDSDRNGWIDEADEIFDQLLIWTKDSRGRDVLCGLGQAGVGAIYLGNTSTEFTMTQTGSREVNARVRKTGIFLYENGMAGTVQHVDLAR